MYKPNFKYTHKIVNLLVQISAARETVLNSPLVPQWEISLRREAILRSVHSSTSIEGNRLSLEQVSELAAGRKITTTRKDKQEVLNYFKVLENINKLTNGKMITEKDILNINKMLTSGTLENPADCGKYRNRYVIVANRLTREVIFLPPDNTEVPGLVNDLIKWLNSTSARELDAVLEAGITHYEFVRIHPFVDGNGRTARILTSLILYLRGFDIKQFFCLDDYYDSDRQAYYQALQKVNQKNLDLTEWLEYFVKGVYVSIEAVRQRVIRLSSERLRKTTKGQVALTERQMKIVEYVNINGKITNRDIRKMFKISNRTALDEINKLIKFEVLKITGRGRSLCYIRK